MCFPRFTWAKPYARRAQTTYKTPGTLKLIMAAQLQFCPLMGIDHAVALPYGHE